MVYHSIKHFIVTVLYHFNP